MTSDSRYTSTSISAERVRQLREERGISLMEAKQFLQSQILHEEIDAARSLEDIKRILHRMAG